jgi:CelD/BcsL family acetyltransferase involved in cellulose biosynthesis
VSREHPEARAELTEALRRTGRVLDFTQVSSGTATAENVIATLRGADWQVHREEAGVCPVVELQDRTWDSYLETRGKEHRYSIQRKLRGLRKRFDVFFEQVTAEADRSEALATLIRLHEARWQGKGSSDAFHTAPLRAFHESFTRLALAEGWLRLYLLRLSGTTVSALYGLRYGDTFSFYQSGFDPAYAKHGVGAATMALSIEAALAEGAQCYDLLHGSEEYKFHWANATRPLARYALFPPRAQGHAAHALSAISALVRPMARRVLQSP